jgi:hypothetical protein
MSDAQDLLRALDLPDEAVAQFLEHIARFCDDHGGERRYADLLALLARLRAQA